MPRLGDLGDSVDLLPVARSVWRPSQYNGTRDDNDLEVFADDAAFAALLT